MIGAIGLFLAATAQAAAAQPACTSDTAMAVSVAEIGRDAERFIGKCVTVGGPMTSLALYGSVEDLYLVHRYGADGNPDPNAVRLGRVGLYSAGDAIRALPADGEGLPHLTVTGNVDTCEQIHDRAMAETGADGLVMLTGYCHYHDGAVIVATSFEVDRARRYDRLKGDKARGRFGNLVFAPPDWADRSKLGAFNKAFRSAVAAGDRERLAKLHGVPSSPTEQDDEHLDRLAAADSPFSALRASGETPSAIFVGRSDILAAAAGRSPDQPYGTICYCKTDDCEGEWPIAASDADNAPQRPYACTTVVWSEDGNGRLETPPGSRQHGWLAEPTSD